MNSGNVKLNLSAVEKEVVTNINFADEIDQLTEDRHLIVTLHGIRASNRTFCEYPATTLKKTFSYGLFSKKTIEFYHAGYNRLGLVEFLLDLRSRTRENQIDSEFNSALESSHGFPVSIIAHSHGTRELFRYLIRNKESGVSRESFFHIFLIAAVCRRDCADQFVPDKTGKVTICDAGLKDLWVMLGAALRPDKLGATGITGFNLGRVIDRIYAEYNHGSGTEFNHFEHFILPILFSPNNVPKAPPLNKEEKRSLGGKGYFVRFSRPVSWLLRPVLLALSFILQRCIDAAEFWASVFNPRSRL